MIQVAINTPLPAMRAGLRALISGDPDLSVVAAGSSLETVLAGLENSTWPDVLVLTSEAISLEMDGLSAFDPGKLAVLLVSDDLREVQQLAESASDQGLRAWGAISPEAPGETLQAAVHALAEGLIVLSPEIIDARASVGGVFAALGVSTGEAVRGAARGNAERMPAGAQPAAGEELVDPLTPREREILAYLGQGLTNKQIALALAISEHTVKFHVSSIYSKLGVSNRTEAVRKGARNGWVPL